MNRAKNNVLRFRFGGYLGALLFGLTLAIVPQLAWAQDEHISKLTEALDHSDAEQRSAAVDQLGDLGARARSAIPALIKALDHADDELRWRAARALGAISVTHDAAPALTARLSDPHPLVRAHAAYALGKIGKSDEAIVAALAAAIGDEDAAVRRAAAGALRALPADPDVVRPIMVKMLENAEPRAIVHAVEALAEGGKERVPVLIEALKHPEARYWVCLILSEIGPDAETAVPALIEVLADELPEVRMEASLALGKIGPAAASAVPALKKALDDPQQGGRYTAVYALGSIGSADADSELEALVEQDDAFLQMLAVWALARIHPDDTARTATAVPLIVAALTHDDVRLRSAAARALSELKAPPEIVGPALIAALKDAEPVVLANASDALASLGAAALPALVNGLGDEELRVVAVMALGRMGAGAKSSVPVLVELLNDDDPKFRVEVQFALGAIGADSATATPALIAALADSDVEVCRSACFALGQIGPAAAGATEALNEMFESEGGAFRLVSIWALRKIHPDDQTIIEKAVPLLTAGLSHERELVRRECAVALGDIGSQAESALDALQRASELDTPPVREAAQQAIAKIKG